MGKDVQVTQAKPAADALLPLLQILTHRRSPWLR